MAWPAWVFFSSGFVPVDALDLGELFPQRRALGRVMVYNEVWFVASTRWLTHSFARSPHSHAFIHSLNHSPTPETYMMYVPAHSLTHSHSFALSLARSLTHSLAHSLTRSLSLTPSLPRSLTHIHSLDLSLIHTHSPTRPLTHSLTDDCAFQILRRTAVNVVSIALLLVLLLHRR